jgi:putative ABC transport system substrate-binding protein
LDTAFAALGQLRADALVIGPYLFFNSRAGQLGALSLRHAVPTISTYRSFVEAGGGEQAQPLSSWMSASGGRAD